MPYKNKWGMYGGHGFTATPFCDVAAGAWEGGACVGVWIWNVCWNCICCWDGSDCCCGCEPFCFVVVVEPEEGCDGVMVCNCSWPCWSWNCNCCCFDCFPSCGCGWSWNCNWDWGGITPSWGCWAVAGVWPLLLLLLLPFCFCLGVMGDDVELVPLVS